MLARLAVTLLSTVAMLSSNSQINEYLPRSNMFFYVYIFENMLMHMPQ